MTAEDRARALCAAADEQEGLNFDQALAAITAAERDATERAAARLDEIAGQCEAAIPEAVARTGDDHNTRLIGTYGANLLWAVARDLRPTSYDDL